MTSVTFLAMSDVRLDPQPAQDAPRCFAIKTSVRVQLFWVRAWASRLAAYGGKRNNRGQDLQLVATICRHRTNHQWHTVAIDQQREFRSFLAAINRAGACRLTSAECAHLRGVDDRGFQVQVVFAMQHGQQQLMQLMPNTSPFPLLQPGTCGFATAA